MAGGLKNMNLPRHDHEWRVARKFRVPEGKILIPGRPYPNVCESKPWSVRLSERVSAATLAKMIRQKETFLLALSTHIVTHTAMRCIDSDAALFRAAN